MMYRRQGRTKVPARRRVQYACVLACAWILLVAIRTGPSFATGSGKSSPLINSQGSRPSFGCQPQPQLERVARVARPAAPPEGHTILGGVLDITLISQQTTIILQCIAASSLVVAGNFLIAKEEEEEKEREEKEKKEEAERAKKREEMMASGKMTKEECDVALGGAKKAVEEEEYDIWRDSLLRYLGYSNELGEALRPVLPAAYLASYCLAFAYVFADSVDKGGRADKKKRLKEAKNTFLMMDTGCEGYLTKEEVQAAFKKLKTPLAEKDIDSYFAKVDTSGNEKIELDEFMAAFEKKDDELVSIIEALEKPKEDGGPLGNPSLVAGADALIWQTIASVALPGFTINRFVSLAEIGCEAQAEGNIVAEYFPTVLGLSMIPIICKPLDELADIGLDATLRPLLFSTLNADTTGTVEFNELSKKLKERDGSIDEKALRQLFDEMDTDSNGCITAEDWTNGGFEKYRAFVGRK